MRLFIRRSVYGLTNQNHFSGTATLFMFGDDDLEENPVSIDGEELIEIEIRPKLNKPEIIKMFEADYGPSGEGLKMIFVSVHYEGVLHDHWVPDDRMAMIFEGNVLRKIEIESLNKDRQNVTLSLKNTLPSGVQQFQGFDGIQEIWITHLPGTLKIAFFYGGLNSLEKKFGTINGLCDQLSLKYK